MASFSAPQTTDATGLESEKVQSLKTAINAHLRSNGTPRRPVDLRPHWRQS